MAEGWCKFHRPFLSSPLWLSEQFTRGQAWVDLFALAGHGPSSIRVRGIKIELARGQVGYSELTLSERWKWSRGKVRRFLRELENEKMLYSRQDNKTTIITIANYDKYQGADSDNGTANETTSGTANGHQTDTIKNVKNEKNQEKNIPATPETEQPGDEQPKTEKVTTQERPKACPADKWELYKRISRGFHTDKESQLGAMAPCTEAKILDGAKAIDTLIRVRGRPEDEVLAVIGWSFDNDFWSKNLRSIRALLKTSGSNGETKYANVLTAMTRDIERKAERSMAKNG